MNKIMMGLVLMAAVSNVYAISPVSVSESSSLMLLFVGVIGLFAVLRKK